mgnify:FL=1
METVYLSFSSGAPPYRGGDVAGFSPEEARPYLDRKVAVVVPAPRPTKPAASEPEEELVLIEFTRSRPPYLAGETAGFSPDNARHYVEVERVAKAIGKARPVVGRPKAEAPPAKRIGGGALTATADPDLVPVRFVKSTGGYRKGDLAGFSQEMAERLIASGAAVAPDSPEGIEAQASGSDPRPEDVDPDAEVVGLDDRDPDWREKAKDGPPVRKMETGSPKDKKR